MLKILIIVAFALLLLLFFRHVIHKATLKKLFVGNSVSVSGAKGKGKDLLFCYVVNLRKKDYISNVLYSSPKARYKCFPLDTRLLANKDLSSQAIVDGAVKPQFYPYPDGLDYYISDAGVYFPSHLDNQLTKAYPSTPIFMALSRHIGDCAVHFNSQDPDRVWLKMREQANKYVACMGAHVFLHRFARLKVGIYQLSDTAKKVLIPPRKRKDKVAFTNMYGRVQIFTIWFKLPYRYDSRGLRKLVISNSFEGFSNE